MRITNGMMVSTLRSNIYRNMTSLDKMQHQMATGKRISKPSDDPVGITYSLRLRNSLVENEQYLKNADDGLGILDATDAALDESGKVLQRIRELTVQAANGTNNQDALNAIKDEVTQLREHLLTVANTEYAGKYIFSGTATDTPAYDAGPPEVWQGNGSVINYEVGVGIKVPVNVTADNLFEDTGLGTSVFQTLNSLEVDLVNGNSIAISGKLGELDNWIEKSISTRSEVGARTNRLEFAKSRLEDTKINFTGLLSNTEDIDMAQLITDMKTQENVYRASLAAGARIVQPTLIDFLR